ncbi:carbonic anhydrase, partial [Ottowia beijingensis]|uniref:carbonic anhydrase n=1 Tax=Ottowia beijingensis TaxID=1207057 RepID=UPI002FD9C92A
MQLTRRHTQRLRQMLRSAGWPMLDVLEAELLTAGLLQRVPGSAGAETLRVTDAGLAAIAASAVSNRAALSAHEALVQRVAERNVQDAVTRLNTAPVLAALVKAGQLRIVGAMHDVATGRIG